MGGARRLTGPRRLAAGREAQLGPAAAKLREYRAFNDLSHLATLTYADVPEDDAGAWKNAGLFRRRIYPAAGGRLPLAIAIGHGGRHGRVHFHVAYGEGVTPQMLCRAWTWGAVGVPKEHDPSYSGGAAGGYLGTQSKTDPDPTPGTTRYSTTSLMPEPPCSVNASPSLEMRTTR